MPKTHSPVRGEEPTAKPAVEFHSGTHNDAEFPQSGIAPLSEPG
jgi:hypothetical protein